MGGGHHGDHHGVHGNENNIQESDESLPFKIREIELIKHNPNLFHLWIYNPSNIWQILGGTPYAVCAFSGAYFSWWYYGRKLAINPTHFYQRVIHRFGRVSLGFTVGATIGYLKFGDRQRLHNAWVAERLRRRYPESMDLDAHNLWKLKGIKANHHFYKWT